MRRGTGHGKGFIHFFFKLKNERNVAHRTFPSDVRFYVQLVGPRKYYGIFQVRSTLAALLSGEGSYLLILKVLIECRSYVSRKEVFKIFVFIACGFYQKVFSAPFGQRELNN